MAWNDTTQASCCSEHILHTGIVVVRDRGSCSISDRHQPYFLAEVTPTVFDRAPVCGRRVQPTPFRAGEPRFPTSTSDDSPSNTTTPVRCPIQQRVAHGLLCISSN